MWTVSEYRGTIVSAGRENRTLSPPFTGSYLSVPAMLWSCDTELPYHSLKKPYRLISDSLVLRRGGGVVLDFYFVFPLSICNLVPLTWDLRHLCSRGCGYLQQNWPLKLRLTIVSATNREISKEKGNCFCHFFHALHSVCLSEEITECCSTVAVSDLMCFSVQVWKT